MRKRRKVSGLKSALPKMNFLHEISDGIVVGNDVRVSLFELQIKVADSLKDIYKIRL
jgi:hypothetical protein